MRHGARRAEGGRAIELVPLAFRCPVCKTAHRRASRVLLRSIRDAVNAEKGGAPRKQ